MHEVPSFDLPQVRFAPWLSVVVLLPASALAQTRVFTLPDPTGVYSCAGAGDFDRDGVPDIVVGSDGNGRGKVTVYSGRWGTVLFSLVGRPNENFGQSVAGAGDVDRDGYDDILVGIPWESTGAYRGSVQVFSGRTHREIRGHSGSRQGDTFGIWVGNAGDFNRDGHPDQLVGAAQQGNGGPGYVQVMSGAADEVVLCTFVGAQSGDRFGCSCAVLGDVDGGGKLDYVIGSRYANLDRRGTVTVFSGETRTPIYPPAVGSSPYDKLGTSVCRIDDLTGDGIADFAAGAEGTSSTPGYVRIYSGANGHRWGTELSDNVIGDDFGHRVTPAGDLDGDRVVDLAVSIVRSNLPPQPGRMRVYSGRTLQPIQGLSIDGTAPTDYFGYALASVGDLNGDGMPELVIGAAGVSGGQAVVVSGAPMPLACDRHIVSRAVGGTLTYRVQAGREHAGKFLAMAGSMTGSSPCTPLGNACVPLVPDAYTSLTLSGRLWSVAPRILDSNGAATVSLVVPRGVWPPALRVHHAAVVFGFYSIDTASNPVPLSGAQ